MHIIFILLELFTLQEKEDQKKLKQKQRDRMQPKMGKMDIDYQVRECVLRKAVYI